MKALRLGTIPVLIDGPEVGALTSVMPTLREGGHAPDRPYNDVPKAVEAAMTILALIPEPLRLWRAA